MGRDRKIPESVKRAKVERALELKEKNPELTWTIIASRLGVYDSGLLRKWINLYE